MIGKQLLRLLVCIGVALAISYPALVIAQETTGTFNLTQTIETALKANLSLKQSREEVNAALATKKARTTNFFPTLSASYGYIRRDQETRQSLQGQQTRIDKRKTRGTKQFVAVGSECQRDRAQQHGRQATHPQQSPHPVEQSRFGRVRDREREAVQEPEVILQVDYGHSDRNQPCCKGHDTQFAGDQEDVKPGRHQAKVDQPGDQDEYPAYQQHATARVFVGQQAEQEQQHEKGAGIEGIHGRHHHQVVTTTPAFVAAQHLQTARVLSLAARRLYHLGQVLDGDQLLAMLAIDMRSRGCLNADTVVVTVMSNLGFRRAMSEAGISPSKPAGR